MNEKGEEEEFNPFADIDDDELKFTFTAVSNVSKLFVRCSRKQREFMERLRKRKGWSYKKMIVEARKEVGREDLRDVGELSSGEADLIIKLMGGERNI